MFAIKSQCFNLLAKAASDFCGKGIKCSRSFSRGNSLQSKWHLMSAAIVERCPIITQKMTKIEREFSDLLWTIEKERSSLSNHSLKHIEDKKNVGKEKDASKVLTAEDMEDCWQEEYKKIQFAPRITDADKNNDQKSLERKLYRKLALLTEQDIGDKKMWVVPMSIRKDNESMRETAERILLESCGQQLKVQFLGNAPWSFFQYEYPVDAQTDHVGAKIFFFKAHYLSGSLAPESPDYRWLTRQEIPDFVKSKKYASILKKTISEY